MRANKRGLLSRRSGVAVSAPAGFTLDFANNSFSTPGGGIADPVVSGLMTVTRNSIGYAQNNDGTFTQFAANTLRKTNKGILIERKAFNPINNQNSGAVASGLIGDTLVANVGTLPNQWTVNFPAGLFYQVLDIGTDPATNLPRTRLRVSGTAGATQAAAIRFMPSGSASSGSPPLNTGDIIIGSVFASVFAGTLPGNMYLNVLGLNGNTIANMLTATESFISGVTSNDTSSRANVYFFQPASTPSPVQRYETYPINMYSTVDNVRMYINFDVVSGTFYDFTLDLIMPQCEAVPDINSRASSPIYSPSLATTWTGTVTAVNSNTVASATGLQVGMVVWGTGVTYKTVITSIVGLTITFNNPITVTTGGTVRFIGGVREQDVIGLAGAALTMAQGATAAIKATTAAFPWRISYIQDAARGTTSVSKRVLPIIGINAGTALLQREADWSLSSAYGAGARTFKTFQGNWTTGPRECAVSWNGSLLELSSAAGGDYLSKASGATSITSVEIGHLGGTASLDGYLSKLVISPNYGANSSVGAISAEVVVYGAKPGGIIAAYRAKKEGRTVAIVGDWREHVVGGMMSGGLGFTDYVDSTKSYTNSGLKTTGTTVFTLTDATGITKGVRVTATNIPAATYVTGVVGNNVTLSAACTGNVADGATLQFDVTFVGSVSPVLRCTSVGTTLKGSNQIVLSHVDNMVVGASISQHLSESSLLYGTKITAINVGSKTVTIDKTLIADLASGTLLKTWTPGGYGGLPRWVFSRANEKAKKADDELYGEPRVFRSVFEDMLCEAGIPVYYSGGVSTASKGGTRVSSFATAARTVSGAVCSAKNVSLSVLIGADYEGDFLPLLSISNSIGREANATYGENHNGYDSSTGPSNNGGSIHQPTLPDGGTAFNVDPWVTAGTPASGPLVGININQVLATTGSGSGTNVGDMAYVTADNKVYRWNGSAWALPTVGMADFANVQAYNFRLTLTKTTGRYSPMFSGTSGSLVTNAVTTATNVLNFASTTGIAVGYGVFGTGIPYGTVVTATTSTTVTINQTVTVASGATISYLNPADFGFSAARAELYIRTIAAFDAAATAASRTFTTAVNNAVSSQTAGQWGIGDFFQPKGGLDGSSFVFDANNVGGISLDYVGGNKNYLTNNYATRETQWVDHINHIRMQWWVLQFYVDARVRAALQTEARLWGFDIWHYTDNLSSEPTNFNSQLYVREGRRMINSEYTGGGQVFSEIDAGYPSDGTPPRDPKTISIMSYALDSHQMQRLPVFNAGNYTYWNEGGIVVFAGQANGALGNVFGTNKRGVLSLGTIMPASTECTNYLTSFHGAMSHPTFGGFRMEPSSMAIGEAAGLLAAMAIEGSKNVQAVTYGDTSTAGTFRYRLLNTGANPAGSPTPPIAPLVN